MKMPIVLYLLVLSASALGVPNLVNDLVSRTVEDCQAVKVIMTILSQYKATIASRHAHLWIREVLEFFQYDLSTFIRP